MAYGSAALVGVVSVVRSGYWRTRMRVRQWGRLPRTRGPTVLIANHQHEDESEIVCERTFLQGPWRQPIFTASSRRMYEPGFFATRLPALRFARRWNAAPLFFALGLLPLENELASRPLASLADEVLRRHGDLPLDQVFEAPALAAIPQARRCGEVHHAAFFARAQTPVKLSLLREPYRREALRALRATIDEDVERIRAVVRSGATFYVTPEGFYSGDGRMRPLRGIVSQLVPLAQVWLAAIAFDPFRGARLSMLYRIVRPADGSDLAASLAAARPVTVSALLAAHFMRDPAQPRTRGELIEALRAGRDGLPLGTFADPELRDCARCVDEALRGMRARNLLLLRDGAYVPAPRRADARFGSADILAYQAAMLEQTIAAARRLAERGMVHSAG